MSIRRWREEASRRRRGARGRAKKRVRCRNDTMPIAPWPIRIFFDWRTASGHHRRAGPMDMGWMLVTLLAVVVGLAVLGAAALAP